MTDDQNRDKVAQVIKEVDALFTVEERINVQNIWNEIARLMLPASAVDFVGKTTRGGKRQSLIYNGNAVTCVRDLSAVLHSLLMSEVLNLMRWIPRYGLKVTDRSLSWIDTAKNVVQDFISASNFSMALEGFLKLFVSIGSGALQLQEGTGRNLLNFNSWHLAQTAWAEGVDGRLDTFARKYRIRAALAAKLFGIENLSEKTKMLVEKSPNSLVEFYELIKPRDDFNSSVFANKNTRPIGVYIIELETRHLVKEDGYYEKSIFGGRWETCPEEAYGYGPGRTALPDVATVETMSKERLQALAKSNNPPMIGPDRGMAEILDLSPGAYNGISGDPKSIQILDFSGNLRESSVSIIELEQRISRIFYLDKLQAVTYKMDRTMTEEEMKKLESDAQRVFSPVINRLCYELLDPLIERATKILIRHKLIEAIPKELAGSADELFDNMKIQYQNSLVRAQHLDSLVSTQSWVQQIAGYANAGHPESLDWINADTIAKEAANLFGVPSKFIESDEDVSAAREERAKAAQQREQTENMLKTGDAIAKLAKGQAGSSQGM